MLRPDPIPDLKRQLAASLVESLRGWTGTETLYAFNLDAARLSDLRHGRLKRFTLQKLIRLLAERDKRVSIAVE